MKRERKVPTKTVRVRIIGRQGNREQKNLIKRRVRKSTETLKVIFFLSCAHKLIISWEYIKR